MPVFGVSWEEVGLTLWRVDDHGRTIFHDAAQTPQPKFEMEAIIETENKLFNLRFKKATRQNFKSHEIKFAKHRLAQLKTLLTSRLDDLEQR